MTNKEIIIDGVDVAGCEFAVKPINDDRVKRHCCKGLLEIAKMYDQPENIKNGLCENNPNCYYKKLKRLEQENARLKENLEDLQHKYSRQYQINENKGYLKAEHTLQEIKEIGGLPYVKIENTSQKIINEILQKIAEVNK